MNNDNFFPSEDYKVPVSSNYMRLSDGENTFRVLGSAVVGFEYWTENNKPVRSKEMPRQIPMDIKLDKEGKPSAIKHFWAFPVYNYEAKKVQILELTQKGIMNTIKSYIDNKKWGNPKGYDIVITRTGAGFDTEYQTIANPHSEIPQDILVELSGKTINLEALFESKDPFEANF